LDKLAEVKVLVRVARIGFMKPKLVPPLRQLTCERGRGSGVRVEAYHTRYIIQALGKTARRSRTRTSKKGPSPNAMAATRLSTTALTRLGRIAAPPTHWPIAVMALTS
jgi:hypothetical protein